MKSVKCQPVFTVSAESWKDVYLNVVNKMLALDTSSFAKMYQKATPVENYLFRRYQLSPAQFLDADGRPDVEKWRSVCREYQDSFTDEDYRNILETCVLDTFGFSDEESGGVQDWQEYIFGMEDGSREVDPVELTEMIKESLSVDEHLQADEDSAEVAAAIADAASRFVERDWGIIGEQDWQDNLMKLDSRTGMIYGVYPAPRNDVLVVMCNLDEDEPLICVKRQRLNEMPDDDDYENIYLN